MADTTSTININTATINAAISGDFSKIVTTSSSSESSGISQYNVNLAGTVISGVNIIEKAQPKDPYSGPFDFAGFGFGLPSTPRTSRGVVEGTPIAKTNIDLSHGCMIFADFASLLGGGLISDIQQLLTLPPARIQLSAWLRIQFSGIIQELQAAINAILEAIGFDPTGMISYMYSQAKALLRMINYWLKDIKQLASDMQAIIMFANQLFSIIQYLLSLPAQLLSMVQSCISSFLGSVMGIAKNFENIPSTVENQLTGSVFNSIGNFANQSLNTINTKANNYKQNNPNYKNLDITTATPAQIQNLISSVATTNTSTHLAQVSSVANSNAIAAAQNPTSYASGIVFNTTSTQTLVVGSIAYDTIYANNIFANTIICGNITVNQNTVSKNATINVLSTNAVFTITSNSVPKISGNGVIAPAGHANPVNNQIAYNTIIADSISANNIICDYLVCNNNINITNSMNTHNISAVNLTSNSTIITT